MKVNLTIGIPAWLDKICTWPVTCYRRFKYGYPYRRIYLGEGEFTIVDVDAYYRLGNLKWFLVGSKKKFYAARNIKTGPCQIKIVRLHRVIMNPPDGLLIDHQNGNSLDNRRANLRFATRSQNATNRQKRKNSSSHFNGVSLEKRTGRWQARICYQGKKTRLAYFDSELEAARAYDRAAIKYHGEFARLNFPSENYADEICDSNQNSEKFVKNKERDV
ncbi:MAG: AP2 domain-containing protein [Sedimentisphaerales bacterium]|nr:AP2 domain-containing protein [Sedimentisphaerales bacterium]